MTDKSKKELEAAGADVAGTLDRFMNNEALYLKFLNKFLEDKNYEGLVQAVTDGDSQQAFQFAHTLKGVAANLGMKGILQPLDLLVERFRISSMEGIADSMNSLKAAYEGMCHTIEQLRD